MKIKRHVGRGNAQGSKATQFKPGNAGRPKGSQNRIVVLRDAIVESAMAIMAHMPNEKTKQKKAIKKMLIEMAIAPTDLLKIASSFVPRQLKLEKKVQTFIGIEVKKMTTDELSQSLISRLTQRGAQAELTMEEAHSDSDISA